MPDTAKLLSTIDSYSDTAYGSETEGELSRQRSLALDAFAGKNIEPAPEGRSQVVDMSVFETVQWIMPSLMRIYGGLNGESIVEFDPSGPEDEDAAEQESEYLNYLVTQKNDWDMVARTWMQDALITKNAYCMAYMEEKVVPEMETYEGQTEEQLALLLEDDVELVGQRSYQDPDDEGTLVNPLTGQPIQSEEEANNIMLLASGVEPQMTFRTLYDIQIRKTAPCKKLQFRVFPPERCKVDQYTPSFQIDDDCNYFEYFEETTISELRKLGYDVPDDIGDGTGNTDSEEDRSRDEVLESWREDDSPDPSMRKVVARFIWVRYDYDEDGIAELLYVVRVGQEILELEHASRIPVASIVPFINTHRHMGISVADVVWEIQRIKQALLRGGLDGLNLSLNPGKYVNVDALSETTIDDLLVSRPGRIVRGRGPYQTAVAEMVTPDVFPSAMQGLAHMDMVLEQRAGVSKNFTGIDSAAMTSGNDYNMVGQLSSMAAQRVEDIARVFASGFKRLFSIAHELIIKNGRVDETIRLRGEWINVDPTQWRTGRDMRVVAPFAAGNKDTLLQRLLLIAQIHEKALASGLPIVDADDAYNLAMEIANAADVPGTKLFTDPATVEPAEPEPDYTAIALEIENKKADNQLSGKQIDSETDRYQTELQAEIDKYKADLDAESDKYRADLQAQVQVALAEFNATGKVDMERFKADLKNAPTVQAATDSAINAMVSAAQEAIKEVADAVQELRNDASAPIKVVRENGKIVGKEVNGRFIRLEDTG